MGVYEQARWNNDDLPRGEDSIENVIASRSATMMRHSESVGSGPTDSQNISRSKSGLSSIERTFGLNRSTLGRRDKNRMWVVFSRGSSPALILFPHFKIPTSCTVSSFPLGPVPSHESGISIDPPAWSSTCPISTLVNLKEYHLPAKNIWYPLHICAECKTKFFFEERNLLKCRFRVKCT